jgi:hypothetical protein
MTIAYNSITYACGTWSTGWDYLSVPNVTPGVERVGYGVCGNLYC